MNIIVCLDNDYGMAFGGHRQSMDRCVRREILKLCCNARLLMNEYSFSQFDSLCDNIIVDNGFLERACNDDFCFIETDSIPVEKTERVYAFFWNRKYPSDLKFDVEINGFIEVSNCDFEGYSHEKITLKEYIRSDCL